MSDFEKEHLKDIQSNCFWAGYLINLPKDQARQIANDIVEAIEFALKQANGVTTDNSKCAIPIVSTPVKITKCKTFKNIDPYKHEKEINEWLSSNKIVIKHTNQSQYREHHKTSYSNYYTYGTLITIFYEDA